jgi:hypothetical protein
MGDKKINIEEMILAIKDSGYLIERGSFPIATRCPPGRFPEKTKLRHSKL